LAERGRVGARLTPRRRASVARKIKEKTRKRKDGRQAGSGQAADTVSINARRSFGLKHTSFPAAGATPATPHISGTRLFASILGALHETRRIQSRRILRQYRHLISHGDQRTGLSAPSPEDRENVDR
jgi:hypothetical protein